MTDESMDFKGTVEAIVFASGEPLERSRLIDALGCTPERLDAVLQELQNDYDDRNSAVSLLLLGSQVQFATRPQYAPAIRNVLDLKKNQPLSAAAFEVLAIIAYNQPVTRGFVEQIRGECGRLDLPGRPLIYCTTADFLKCFCMSTLAELPEVSDTQSAAQALQDVQRSDPTQLEGQMSIF